MKIENSRFKNKRCFGVVPERMTRLTTILILLLLAFGFYTGAKRGLILQVLYSVGYLISYFVARTYYKEVASFRIVYSISIGYANVVKLLIKRFL